MELENPILDNVYQRLVIEPEILEQSKKKAMVFYNLAYSLLKSYGPDDINAFGPHATVRTKPLTLGRDILVIRANMMKDPTPHVPDWRIVPHTIQLTVNDKIVAEVTVDRSLEPKVFTQPDGDLEKSVKVLHAMSKEYFPQGIKSNLQ